MSLQENSSHLSGGTWNARMCLAIWLPADLSVVWFADSLYTGWVPHLI